MVADALSFYTVPIECSSSVSKRKLDPEMQNFS